MNAESNLDISVNVVLMIVGLITNGYMYNGHIALLFMIMLHVYYLFTEFCKR